MPDNLEQIRARRRALTDYIPNAKEELKSLSREAHLFLALLVDDVGPEGPIIRKLHAHINYVLDDLDELLACRRS